MNNKQFERIINKQFDRCKELLVTKGKEYTPDRDIFEVFNKAATLSGKGGRKAALFSFMLKHLVSISDMCHSNETYDMDRWNEKITDAMNYLLLLKAMVEEDGIFRNDPLWRVTGYTPEELAKKLTNTEIKADQVVKKCPYDCNDCVDADCDGTADALIDCNNNCNGCAHLLCGRKADNDEPLEDTTAEDWEELWKDADAEVKTADIAELETSKDCKNCGIAIWSLNTDKNKDKPICFKKALGECDGDARVPGPTSKKKDYNFKKYRCNSDSPYCILGGPEKCPTCKHWIEKESTLSVEEEIARAQALEDDLK